MSVPNDRSCNDPCRDFGRLVSVKRMARLFLVLLVGLSLLSAANAQDVAKVKGWVSRVDAGSKSLTILPEGGTAVTIIMGSDESLSKVQEGDEAEARYTVKDGKNFGRWLRKVEGGCS
jgi:hypothetical protein